MNKDQKPLDASIAFDAMSIFLEKYWNLCGRPESIGVILSSMERDNSGDGMPLDPATWEDWLISIEAARNIERT